MAVRGVFASDSSIQGDRTGDFASALLQIMPTGSAQLFALTSGMKSAGASDVLVHWFEENHISGRVKSTATYNSTATSIVVDDASSYIPGTICLVEDTGEYILVSNVASNTLTIERGFGGTTAGSITTNKYLQRIGTAHEEASSRPPAIANLGHPVFNYMQIFRNAWNISGTARAIKFHTGDKVAKNKQDAANFHAEDIERSILWGKQAIGIQNGEPFRTMNGVLSFITTNVQSAGSTTDFNDIQEFLKGVFSRNIKGQPNERIAFCGNDTINVLNNIARIEGTINISAGQTEFGLQIYRWLTPFGNITLMTHPLMTESPLWTKDLYVLHPAAIVLRYLRKTFHDRYDAEGRRAGDDADFGVYTTELSLEYHAEVTGGKMTGFTAAAAVS